MVSPSRSSTSARGREDAGSLFLGALVLLGLVASGFLVLSDSLQYLRVGLVAALWAAVLGAWAVSRYQAKAREMRRVYRLELEREISARREHEFGVEARVRAEVGAEATEMAALRAELAVLRRQLQRLFDGDLPEERPALRAAAVRVHELPGAEDRPGQLPGWRAPDDGERHAVDAWANAAASWSHAADGWVDPEPQSPGIDDSEVIGDSEIADLTEDSGTGPDTGGARDRDPGTPVYETDHPSRPRFAGPDDAPVTAETAIVRLDQEPPWSRSAPDMAGPSWADAFTEVDHAIDDLDASDNPAVSDSAVSDSAVSDSAVSDSDVADGEDGEDERDGTPIPAHPDTGPAGGSEKVPAPAAAAAGDPEPSKADAAAKPRERSGRIPTPRFPRSVNSRRRRTQTDPAGTRKLSVAEIMANLRQEEEQRSS
ncbi:DUF6779 domain-containing protein [Nocardia sp. NPDC024068]|uniref:DUF6779 domain-containing protein n=1 Tax=Nocardia sp. NPDC024068 TaxID=3157197 RepID=UPI003408A0B8